MLLKYGVKQIKHMFSSTNLRFPIYDANNQRRDINSYHPIFQTYIHKRRITQQQIPPKIHIIQNQMQNKHLSYQKLIYIEKNEKKQRRINTQSIINLFCDDNLRQLLKQYSAKVLMCGKMLTIQQVEIQQKVIDLYRIFFFGEKITQFERQIQSNYASIRRSFWQRYEESNLAPRFKCLWNRRQENIYNQIVNYRSFEQNLSDEVFRQYYQPIKLKQRYNFIVRYFQILNLNWLQRWRSRSVTNEYKTSQTYYNVITSTIYQRVLSYTKCKEFQQFMKIPPDYFIQLASTYIHFWIIINRLRREDTRQSRYIAEKLQFIVKRYLDNTVNGLNVKKRHIVEKNIDKIVNMVRLSFEMHFHNSNITSHNHSLGIDSLVWVYPFNEKIERYSDQVYIFADYLLRNFQHIQRHSIQDIYNGIIQFDVHLVDPKCKQLLQRINPPLTEEQFQKQAESNAQIKKYSYNMVQKDVLLPIDKIRAQNQKLNITLRQLFEPLQKIIKRILGKQVNNNEKNAQNNAPKQKSKSVNEMAERLKRLKYSSNIQYQLNKKK